MYQWVKDKEFLNRAYRECSDLVNQLVQHLKHYDVEARMNAVGSKTRNMVTQNEKEPIDFDFNLLIENADDFRNGRELKEIIKNAFNEVLSYNDWDDCEDSTAALTTKRMAYKKGNRTPFSIDVCIVKEDHRGLYRLIHQKTGFINDDRWFWNLALSSQALRDKEKALKPDYWTEVREVYLNKKNMYLMRRDHDHPSFICYIEAVNEVYNRIRYGYVGR